MPEPSKGIGAAGFGTEMTGGVNYLLAIAIDAYKHLPFLYNCKKDAETFIGLLVKNYQFEEANVVRVFDEAATLKGIHAAFRELVGKVTPKDNLVVYFSGHGEYDSLINEGYWIPIEAHQGSLDEYFSNDTVRRYLSSINSHHTFLIADSCFSGALFEEGTGKSGGSRSERDPSRWGLTAGRKEIVSDGKPGMHSPFADALLDRLRKNQGSLGVQKLCAEVLEQVEANAFQTPIGEPLRVQGHRNGQFYFHLRRDEVTDWALAQKENTIEAYTHFLALYPDGKFHHKARTALENETAEKEWQAALKANTVQAFLSFERQFPQSSHVQEVDDMIAGLEEEKLWEEASRSHIITGYREYLRRSRLKKYLTEALAAIDHLSVSEEEIRKKEMEAREAQLRREEEAARIKERERKEMEVREALIRWEEDEKGRIKERERKEIEAREVQRSLEVEKAKRRETEEKIRHEAEQRRKKKEKLTIIAFDWNRLKIPLSIVGTTLVIAFVVWLVTSKSSILYSPPEMVFVQGGTFTLGCTGEQGSDCEDNEIPAHEVTVGDFKIGKYEVTQAEWEVIMGFNPSYFRNCSQCPVEDVSWNDIQEFIKKLNQKTGDNYRLPTEAEWEYAARGGKKSKKTKYAGSNNIDEVSWYSANSGNKTHPVGGKAPNELGIYDMSGNVWEWCADWYGNYSSEAQTNPTGPTSGLGHVGRGGGWSSNPMHCRVADRDADYPTFRNAGVGFRLALSIGSSE